MLLDLIDSQIANGRREQNNLYENTVGNALAHGDSDKVTEAFAKYYHDLEHFDIIAFDKVFTKILDLKKTDEDKFMSFAEHFQAIPEYALKRNNFNERKKEILSQDGSPADKEAMFKALDANRTKAHNKLILLFNRLNKFANDNQLPQPYPNNGREYDPQVPLDRQHVADVLGKQMPLMENVQNYLLDEAKELNKPTQAELLMGLTPSEAIKLVYAVDSIDEVMKGGLNENLLGH